MVRPMFLDMLLTMILTKKILLRQKRMDGQQTLWRDK